MFVMARTMSSDEYRELGRAYYKEKKYEQAVDSFTEGLNVATPPSVGQYDERAASYEKLGDFNSALKDGRTMIKLDKNNVKGYLRTSSLLQKTDKPEKALAIYKYGMKNVVDSKDFRILQQLHDKLTRQLSPPKSIDPLTVLPPEIAKMIIGYLSFKNMVNCLRVSKGWKTFLTGWPDLWLDIDLSGARKEVSRVFMRNAVRYSQNKVQRLVVYRFRHNDMLGNIGAFCKELSDVAFISGSIMSKSILDLVSRASSLKTISLYTEVTLDTVSQVLNSCPLLEHIVCDQVRARLPTSDFLDLRNSLRNLHTLELRAVKGTILPRIHINRDILKWTPVLKVLRLGETLLPVVGDLSTCSLTHLKLETYGTLTTLPHTLKHLDIRGMGSIGDPSVQEPAMVYLPLLTHLRLSCWHMYKGSAALATGAYHFSDNEINAHGEMVVTTDSPKATSLESLILDSCTIDEDADLFSPEHGILGQSRRVLTNSLRHLEISNHPATDDDIDKLLNWELNGLHTVNFPKTKITGAGVKRLIDTLPKLRSLNLDDCPHITSHDICDYAAKRGIKVSMKRSDVVNGKKVRYGN